MSHLIWHRSSYSGTDGSMNCVEVATSVPGLVAVRDSKDPDGPVLRFGADAWVAFRDAVARGSFGE